ncbi:hypothetical protein STENM327S_09218 [Streptomyces tendae]
MRFRSASSASLANSSACSRTSLAAAPFFSAVAPCLPAALTDLRCSFAAAFASPVRSRALSSDACSPRFAASTSPSSASALPRAAVSFLRASIAVPDRFRTSAAASARARAASETFFF